MYKMQQKTIHMYTILFVLYASSITRPRSSVSCERLSTKRIFIIFMTTGAIESSLHSLLALHAPLSETDHYELTGCGVG